MHKLTRLVGPKHRDTSMPAEPKDYDARIVPLPDGRFRIEEYRLDAGDWVPHPPGWFAFIDHDNGNKNIPPFKSYEEAVSAIYSIWAKRNARQYARAERDIYSAEYRAQCEAAAVYLGNPMRDLKP